MDIEITTTQAGKVALASPYDADLVRDAKKVGGKWDPASRTWQFDARDVERVRELARAYFGTDGTDPQGDLVTVRVKLADREGDKWHNAARFANRVIARRPGRDSEVVLAANVVLVEGELASRGGSTQYPMINAGVGVVVEIRDIPRSSLALEAEGSYEIVGEAGPDVDALLSERDRLLARLAEIDALLPEPEGTTATTREAAAALGVSIRTVQRWAATGKVEAAKDVAGRWVITITADQT